jgi:recombination protein RecR
MNYAKPLAKLVGELEKLPGIGPKSAQRIAFYILRAPEEYSQALSEAIAEIKQKIVECKICFNLSDKDVCDICANEKRDKSMICVVSEPRDLIAMEKTNEFNGLYHVLQGLIAPMDGIGPEMLRVRELIQRLSDDTVKEVILAINPTVEGDLTVMYLAKLIKPLGIKVTRIANGISIGGDIDYADQLTLIRALQWRRDV